MLYATAGLARDRGLKGIREKKVRCGRMIGGMGAIAPGQRGQSDPLPGRCRTAEDLAQHAPGPATECQETNTSPVQSVQVGVGGQLQIEHQLGRVLSDLLAPELDESQDFVGLFELGNSGVSVATRWPASRAKNVRMPFWLRLRREM